MPLYNVNYSALMGRAARNLMEKILMPVILIQPYGDCPNWAFNGQTFIALSAYTKRSSTCSQRNMRQRIEEVKSIPTGKCYRTSPGLLKESRDLIGH